MSELSVGARLGTRGHGAEVARLGSPGPEGWPEVGVPGSRSTRDRVQPGAGLAEEGIGKPGPFGSHGSLAGKQSRRVRRGVFSLERWVPGCRILWRRRAGTRFAQGWMRRNGRRHRECGKELTLLGHVLASGSPVDSRGRLAR